MTVRQLKLQGVESGPQHNQVYANEAQIQATIEAGLAYLGYIVLHTQHRYRLQTCPNCSRRFRPAGGYGADKAIPDLLVTHPAWSTGIFIGLEIKGPKTAISPEQRLLAAQGRIVIVRSWEDAIAAVEAAHEQYMRHT